MGSLASTAVAAMQENKNDYDEMYSAKIAEQENAKLKEQKGN